MKSNIRYKLLEKRVSYKEALRICEKQGWKLISKNDLEYLQEFKNTDKLVWCKEEVPRESDLDEVVMTPQYGIDLKSLNTVILSKLRLEYMIVKIDKNKVYIGEKIVYNNKIHTIRDIENDIITLDDGSECCREELITKEDLR